MFKHFKKILATSGLLLTLGCVSMGSLTLPPIIHQHSLTDCAVATMAMATHHTYEQIDRDVKRLKIDLSIGMEIADLLKLARAEHLNLIVPGTIDWAHNVGILIVQFSNGDVHAIYLYKGWILDPEQDSPQPWQRGGWKVLTFLQIVK